MRLRSFLPVAASLIALALGASRPSLAQYQLVWQDEFDGTAVDLTKWEFQIGNGCPSLCGWGNNELQYYRSENATVANGMLTISAKEEAVGGRDYTSTRMRSQFLADFLYGRFEMRAKLPEGQGFWPAFWMLPTNSPYGGWPFSGEIDIMEFLGSDTDRVFGTIHYGGPSSVFRSTGFNLGSGTFTDSFHTFAMEWDPNEIRWFVDGQQYACRSSWYSNAGGGNYPAPFDSPFHMLLNLAVGGNLPGAPDASTPFPGEFVIDYVRVYQKQVDTCCILFDGMDHDDLFTDGWFSFNGGGGGGISRTTTDLPPIQSCSAAIESGWGGSPGFIGGFGRTNPIDLTDMTHFEFWINPDAGQTYNIEINLQDDDNGDSSIPSTPDGADDEYQYVLQVAPVGGDVIAGGGWQFVSIPLTDFFDDNSFHWGGNGVFDPFVAGNGPLVNVVWVIISPSGGSQTFRTDYWNFRSQVLASTPLDPAFPGQLSATYPNPFGSSTQVEFQLQQPSAYTIDVFDLRGRLVRRLEHGRAPEGTYSVAWDGRTETGEPAVSGVYVVKLEAGDQVDTRKIVLRR